MTPGSWDPNYEVKADGRVGFDPGMATADRAEHYRTMADFNQVVGREVDANVSHAVSLMLAANRDAKNETFNIVSRLWRAQPRSDQKG